MADREYLFPVPGSALRGLLDLKAQLGEQFSENEAVADIMLDLDRIERPNPKQSKLKPRRYYAKRWGWSTTNVHRAFSGDPDRETEAWIEERARQWRAFRASNVVEHGGNTVGTSGEQNPPETSRKRRSGNAPGTAGEQAGNSTEQNYRTTEEKKGVSRASAREGPDLWDEFWQAYPVKRSKQPARKKWTAKGLHRDAEKARSIIDDVERRTQHDAQWLRGYIPHPSTYLNQERWTDELIHAEDDAGGLDRHGSGGRAGRQTPPRQGVPRREAARQKRDGELSQREYLERCGFPPDEIDRMLGIDSGGDGAAQRSLPAPGHDE